MLPRDVPRVRFAYADPPYLGMCSRYGHEHHGGGCWDDVSTHAALIERLGEYDGWALSLSTVSLATILPMCPVKTRVLAYCKTWAAGKPGINPVYAWEPVLMHGARRQTRRPGGGWSGKWTTDWIATPARLTGFFGNKPEAFTHWLMLCLGVQPDDQFDDLFPGSGAVTKAYEAWVRQQPLGLTA
jgi:hypothetical protein